jgi:SulP family sulfate permease
MMQISKVDLLGTEQMKHALLSNTAPISKEIEIFELSGPFFFGAAYKFKDAIKIIEKKPKVIIVDMANVPVIDATGIHTIKDILHMCRRDKTILMICGIKDPVLEEFRKSRLLFQIGKRFVVTDLKIALERASAYIKTHN